MADLNLTRISHTPSTASAQSSGLTVLRDPQAGTPGLLNVPYSTFAGASVARGATHSDRPFRRFVTSRCEKSGLNEQHILYNVAPVLPS